MKRTLCAIAAVAGLVTVAAPAASYAAADETPAVRATKVTMNGTGCISSNDKAPLVEVSDNRVAVTQPSLNMIAGAGAPVSRREFRKQCQIAFDGNLPKGYTYGIKSIRVGGSAYIEHGAKGSVSRSAYFQGESATLNASSDLEGLFTGRFSYQNNWGSDSTLWAPCGGGRYLNIKTAFTVSRGTQTEDSYSWIRGDEYQGLVVEFMVKKCQ